MTDDNQTPDIPVEVEPAPTEPEDKAAVLEKEKGELYDRLLRTAADFDNYKKRTRKEMDEARLKSREEVLKEVLPGIDNLERAIGAAAGVAGAAGVIDGIKLVLRQFQSALERFDVRGFDSVGQPFDPARHEAISQIETTAFPAGSVAAEMQRGYLMGNRLLRPALVAVAKAPAQPEPEPEPEPVPESEPA